MTAQYFTFKDPSLPTIAQVGGKGLSLIYLNKKGFNVPPLAVLSTEFFRPWMNQLKSAPEWKEFSQAADDDRVAAATAVKKLCQTLTFSAKQKQLLTEVRQYLQTEGITLMAVRSSSPEEDMEGTSFAGIYETVLGVTDSDLEAAIKTCFASALDERVVAYKQKSGFDPLDPKIAAIIQKQIASEASGVAFSLNPVNNSYDQCVINANFGLGETVVDGTVTPDEAIVDKVTKTILKKSLGIKDIAVYLEANGSIKSESPASPSEFCISDDQIVAISKLTTRIETEYGKPMDIEWAYESGQLYLLQARPITTYYKLPAEMITQPGEQKHLYHDATLTEQGLPESLSPLGSDLFMILGRLILPGVPNEDFMSIDRGMAFGSVGRMYTHFGRMLKIMGKKNAIKTYRMTDSLGSQILEAMNLKEYIPKKLPKGFMKSFIRTGVGAMIFVRPLMKARSKPDEYLQHYVEENRKLRVDLKTEHERHTSLEDFAITSYLKVGTHMNGVQLPALMASETARLKLKKMFKNEPDSVQEHLRSIEQSFPNNVTIEMGLLLYELAQFPDIRQIGTAQEFAQKLNANQLSPEFVQKWQSFVEYYGFRGPRELDVATPRYYEKPDELFDILKTMEGHDDPDLTPQGLFESGAKRRVESVQFLEKYLAKKSRRKANAFKKNYKLLENFAAYRESPKYYIIIVIDYIRRRVLAMGKQWVGAGRLDSVNQVFDLKWDELKRAEVDTTLDIRTLAVNNREYYAQFNPNNDPPVVIDSRGFIPKLPPQPLKENELVGTPVSSGFVVGKVKVLKCADEKPILTGDILVTKATDPGWTTLFINAAGVLLESGGALQHGASVAREMGKPCIVGIEDVTRTLKDGQTVEMDGSTGVIKILSESTANPA
ncbi:MAG: PEP/pyruvate-binding domain-containing protein [Nitrospirales bacterium]